MTRYLTITEAAAIMALSIRRTRSLVAAGRLPGARKFGRDWQVPQTSAEAWRPIPGRGNPNWRKDSTPAPTRSNTPPILMCRECHGSFMPARSDAVYCSSRCSGLHRIRKMRAARKERGE